MADLNSTLVRGNLRVTEDANVNGSISEGGTLLSNKYQAKLSTQTAYSAKGSATKVPQITTNSLGQVTGITEVTITDNDHNQTVKGNGTAFGANDAIDIVPGSNITITPDTTNKKITIAASQPTVNNGTLTIQKNGTTVATFTANQAGNSTANITVPTTLDDVADGSTRKLANYLPLSGGTLTGNLNLKANQYDRQGALNCNNSDIMGVNSIYTQDTADNTAEGIRFYRDSTHYDSFTMSGGVMYFMPNDVAAGTAFSSAKVVLHSGNYDSYAIPKTLTTTKGDIIYASAANTPARLAIGTEGQVLKVNSSGVPAWAADSNTNTWRNVKVDGTEKLGTGTGTGALNFVSQNTNNGDITFTYDGGIKATAKVPSVGNGTLTIQGNGTAATTFTANQSGNSTLNIKGGGRTTVTKSADGEITISSTGDGNDNQTVKGNGTAFGANDAVNIIPGSNITVTANTTNKTITIAGTANDNQTVKGNGTAFGANDAVDIVAGSNITVTADTTNKKITIAGTANDNQKVKTSSVTFGANDVVEIKAGSNVTVTGDSSAKTITIAASQPTVNNGTLTIQKNGTNVATFTANQSGNSTANITVPVNFEDISSRGEEWLAWGGRSVQDVSPVGAAMSNEHSANRLAFFNGDLIVAEYSSNGGSSWTTYSADAATKSQFCTTSTDFAVGRPDSTTEITANQSKTRFTITAQDGNNPSGRVYTDPRKLLVYVSSATSLELLIETRTGTNYKSGGAWSTFGTYTVSGWSGWNDIPLVLGTLGGGDTQTGNIWQLRLTFTATTKSASYPKNASVLAIRLYGTNSWSTPSTYARTGHMYEFNMSKSVSFPNDVSALRFVENGTSLADKYLGKSAKAADADKLDGKDSTEFVYYSSAPTATPSGITITNPGGSNAFSIKTRATSGRDIGILYMSDDNAYICNSSDNVYNFAVFDTDVTLDFSNANNAEFAVVGAGNGALIRGNTVIHSGNISQYASKVEIVDLR